jgi:hypothetical protein
LISWTVVLTILIPVMVGREATYHFIGRDVHDGINLVRSFPTLFVTQCAKPFRPVADLWLLHMFDGHPSRQAGGEKSCRPCSQIP